MLKSLSRTFSATLFTCLLIQLGSVQAFAQTRKMIATSSKKSSARNSSNLVLKSNMSGATKVAHYKRAQTLSQTATSTMKDIPEEKIVTGSVGLAHSQSLVDHRDGSRGDARSVIMSVNTKVNSDWNFMTRVSYEDNPRDIDSIQNGFSDLNFSLGHKSEELADWVTSSYSLSAVLPTSKYSKEFQNLQTSIGASCRFSLTPVVLAKGFDFSLSIGASRNFHQYETDKSGRVLNEYSLREIVSGSYSYKNLTFSADLMLRHGLSYNGQTSQAFEHSQEIGYSITPRWGVSVGHTNSGSWFRPNGQDSNLKLIDENNSIIYGSTSLTF